MKITIIQIILVCLALSAGHHLHASIEIGMTPDQVVRVYGDPVSSANIRGVERMVFRNGAMIEFRDGAVAKISGAAVELNVADASPESESKSDVNKQPNPGEDVKPKPIESHKYNAESSPKESSEFVEFLSHYHSSLALFLTLVVLGMYKKFKRDA